MAQVIWQAVLTDTEWRTTKGLVLDQMADELEKAWEKIKQEHMKKE